SQAALGLQTIHQAGLAHGHLAAESVILTADGIVKLCGLGEPAWLAETPLTGDEDAAADLAALGRIAAGWVELGQRGAKKVKPLPAALQALRERLTTSAAEQRYASAGALLEELDQADVPPNAEAWDRLLRHVREALTAQMPLRRSA